MSTQNIFPALRYRDADADAALAWLTEAFRHRGSGRLPRPRRPHPARSAEARGRLIMFGSREFSVRDLEGNLWSFETYNPHDC